jgi:hypothetical protein
MRNAKYVLASAIVIALTITPFALGAGEGTPVKGGARNPSANPAVTYSGETQIIANNATYGTRQSNKGAGGGAIYGCRATNAVPCLRSADISTGQAFQMATNGPLGGTITANGGDNAKPFTTNATGVATGLNADRVDSMNASDIVTATRALSPFASISAAGALVSGKGVAGAAPNNTDPGGTVGGNYTVVFTNSVASCAIVATESQLNNGGAIAVELQPDGKTVFVRTREGGESGGGSPTAVTAEPFNIVAEC